MVGISSRDKRMARTLDVTDAGDRKTRQLHLAWVTWWYTIPIARTRKQEVLCLEQVP